LVDTSNWFDRRQAAHVLRVAVNTIVNRQKRGQLNPRWAVRRDNNGAERLQLVYNPKELEKFLPRPDVDRHRTAGETAAICFEAFDARTPVRQIVIDLREDPDTIETLHEKWLRCGGADRVINNAMWKALEELLGPMTDVTDIVDRVTELKTGLSPTMPTI
jgi:hypothetical protein